MLCTERKHIKQQQDLVVWFMVYKVITCISSLVYMHSKLTALQICQLVWHDLLKSSSVLCVLYLLISYTGACSYNGIALYQARNCIPRVHGDCPYILIGLRNVRQSHGIIVIYSNISFIFRFRTK